MSKHIFAKMAVQNIKSNRRIFFPYLLTIIGTVAGYYICLALGNDPGIMEMRGNAYVISMMNIGSAVILFFSAIFLIYTNSFVVKRRQKEMGLYSVLGMGKRHIALMLSVETLIIGAVGVAAGIGVGVLFYKLCLLALYKIVDFPVPFGFYVSFEMVSQTVLLFAVIIGFTLLSNLWTVMRFNTIQLMGSQKAGEKEPKASWLLTLIGIAALGGGYYIALNVTTAVEALAFYFAAVFLVIIGTYLLFTTVSIAVMKLLKRNLRFYYKSRNFIALSGMLYRMKRNAVGLANICILSTMVLVMLSGTVSLYVGTEDSIESRCPADITSTVVFKDENEDMGGIVDTVRLMAAESGARVERTAAYRYIAFAAMYQGEGAFTTDSGNYATNSRGVFNIVVIPYDEAKELLFPELTPPEKGQAYMAWSRETRPTRMTIDFGPGGVMAFELLSMEKDFVVSYFANDLTETCYLVVPDASGLMAAYDAQALRYGDEKSHIRCEVRTELTKKDYETQETCRNYLFENLRDRLNGDGENRFMSLRVDGRESYRREVYTMNGSFLFIGIFLGLIFVMGAALIIYYKQVTEGYDDRERFKIMQQVGLSHKEVKSSVRAQILMVFFLPLLVATMHIAFDFPIMLLLLRLFSITDGLLVAKCTGVVFAVFALLYAAVYSMTAGTYYKIVS